MRGLQERRVGKALSLIRLRRTDLLVFGIAAVVVAIDQVTKTAAQDSLAGGPVHVLGPIDLSLTYNSGAAFGIGEGHGGVVGVIALVVVGLLWWFLHKQASWLSTLGGGLAIGGALGNLTDRVIRHNSGAVIDFVYTKFWPTFNVADACIVVGVVMLAMASMARQ